MANLVSNGNSQLIHARNIQRTRSGATVDPSTQWYEIACSARSSQILRKKVLVSPEAIT